MARWCGIKVRWQVRKFSMAGDTLTPTDVLEQHRGALTVATFSPDGSLLATADANREIIVHRPALIACSIAALPCLHAASAEPTLGA